MVGNNVSINQDTSVDLSCIVEYSDQEEYCLSGDDNTPQVKNTQNKLSILYKFFRITDYQELKLSAREEGNQYTENIYSSNHFQFNQVMISKWIKDKKISIA